MLHENILTILVPFQIAGKYPIITFEEFLAIAQDAPRVVGIYPEIKNPVLMNQHVSLQSHSLDLHFLLVLKTSLKRLLHHPIKAISLTLIICY